MMDAPDIKDMIRSRYGSIATAAAVMDNPAASASTEAASCCAPSCCAPAPVVEAPKAEASCCAPAGVADQARQMGYSDAELAAIPEGANLGLGCGNPQAIAAMKPGEVVIDLGSGAGFDCFLAARAVGETGHVIGVDMTHEMLAQARANASRIGARNVEFRLGELEHLPVADATADVILSNCVINLVPDKPQVFREAFRVLKRGGRLAISDVVNVAPLSAELAADPTLMCGCVSGAAPAEHIEAWLTEAGFEAVRVTAKPESREMIATWAPGRGVEDCVVSATIEAWKP